MSMRYQAGFLTALNGQLLAPNAPTIGTATAGDASASVTFTAPANVGGGAITGYIVTSSPAGITGSGASSPITVSGLTNGTAYTFTVTATNAFGTSPSSAASNSVTPTVAIVLQVAYTTAGTYTWVAPSGLSPASVSVVCVGGGGGANYGGGGGGGLGYKNGYGVTSGNSYTVVVGAGGQGPSSDPSDTSTSGGDSYFISTAVVKGGGGQRGRFFNSGGGVDSSGGAGGTYTGDGGASGGAGGPAYQQYGGAGSGGAAGYTAGGGDGGQVQSNANYAGANGNGGGGGGGGGDRNYGGGGGGGVGILGAGSSGTAGAAGTTNGSPGFCGTAGSGGTPTSSTQTMQGGLYGGGGATYNPSTRPIGAQGAVRIIWSLTGVTRSFPSTNTGNL